MGAANQPQKSSKFLTTELSLSCTNYNVFKNHFKVLSLNHRVISSGKETFKGAAYTHSPSFPFPLPENQNSRSIVL